ncbi:D-alanyl-D-alanine dipeptidase [Maribellus comscasis]|uniref:D-alanyl-D-alanine dipeptidase n=1 Tax=Maribellus comscasis TaxID=2681766 RepID=A0A6I6K9Q8_9BACT|nr:M15 family metallopeptidase [Maribellus comscasis]QGY46844.1 D-alanyl-D-alanine dipeptidase [Maribellus comscasis]
MEIDVNNSIPQNLSIKGWKNMPIRENHEPLIPLNDFAEKYITVKSQYFEQKIAGALEICYCREGLAKKLVEAAKYLPQGYKFLVWDVWRPTTVQRALFEKHKKELRSKNPDIEEALLLKKTERYVSVPSTDSDKPSPHLTGGAIDITIIDSKGNELQMGTEFDYFGERAKTDYYELYCSSENDLKFQKNRRLLYNLLTHFGFTNYPEEWWHYDYGNQFWASLTKRKAFYGGVLNI